MIKIENNVLKKQNNFWNNCVFHPTDAIEDPWGKRILDQISLDKAINTVRIYTMFEDIVYLGEDGNLCYDFRLNDLRLDYLVEKGYNLLLSYAGIPDCIASSNNNKTSVSKNKTRYKGKMWNSSPPSNISLWEEICYEYTKHIIERYGINTVSRWKCQCFNEPDIPLFFFSNFPNELGNESRIVEYCKMYKGFVNGITRATSEIKIGGPALAVSGEFLGRFLDFVKQENLKLDFISLHDYGTTPDKLNNNSLPFCVDSIIKTQQERCKIIAEHNFENTPIIVDEWGMSSAGFYNKDECPKLMARETEVFSAYFVKLIKSFIDSKIKIDMLALCLSGQHEMVEDFSGFRNFFTLNFIKKPIYNAFVLASKLGENLLNAKNSNKEITVIPTKKSDNNYSVLLSYSNKFFEEDIKTVEETIEFPEEVKGKTVTIWCIDKENTNPYRLFKKLNIKEPTTEEIKILREEGKCKPFKQFICSKNEISLTFTPNSIYLITVE